ncbi:MAG: dienelactone hydrolase family protein [Chloroflexi bacterium]|nr:dienelactone hydrolase family protein [Chloroflexota bacterium]
MCYDSQARPPVPPIAGGAATGEEIVLTAADGNRFAGYIARSGNAAGASVLIYPDVRGLHQFYKELALRFAEIGHTALAIDYFGRTAGLGVRDDAFEFRPHVEKMTLPTFYADVRAGLDYLRLQASGKVFVTGFCMGGTLTLLSGTEDFGFAGIIPFYSGFGRVFPGARGTALAVANTVRYPVLGLYGGADAGVLVADVEKLDVALDITGVKHDIVIYPGAPHSFFDRRYAEFADASADAWTRIIAFIAANK